MSITAQETARAATPVKYQLRAALHALEAAQIVPPRLMHTLSAMVRTMSSQTRTTVATAQVTTLSQETGRTEKTLRNHIAELIKLGLVSDKRTASGRRALHLDCNGDVLCAAGICLAPLLLRVDEFKCRRAARIKEQQAHKSLRIEISILRREVGQRHDGQPDTGTDGPRRLAGLALDELRIIRDRLRDITREKGGDEPEKNVRHNNHHEFISVPPEKKECDRHVQSQRPHPTLAMMAQLIDSSWAYHFRNETRLSWPSLSRAAHERCAYLGIKAQAWTRCTELIGSTATACLVVLADIRVKSDPDHIRNLSGWIINASKGISAGTGDLSSSVLAAVRRSAVD